ncbi:MAG: MFS transporter [Caulobacteraceae bacterium]
MRDVPELEPPPPPARVAQPPLDPASYSNGRKYLIFAIMAFGQFMALIDIQIVAASLNDVQAGLSAGPDEISWIQTGYLMAELVMIPFSAFLAQALSTRWLFALSAGLFTVSSALCGASWDIQSMIAFRVLQGFVGGAMVPTVFATGFTLFSGPQRAMIPAILGMVSVLAPTLGPTVGGWLTDAVGWRSIFYVNIVPGAVVTALAILFIKVDRPNLAMLKKIDWSHLAAMATFLGGLEYVLEEGPPPRLAERPGHRHRRLALVHRPAAVPGALVPLRRADRAADPVPPADLCLRLRVQPSDRLWPLFGDLPRPRLPGPGARLQLAADRHDRGRHRHRPDPFGGDRRPALADGRSAQGDHGRPDPVRRQPVVRVLRNGRLGLLALLGPQMLRGFAIMLCIVPSVNLALTGFEGAELRAASGLFNPDAQPRRRDRHRRCQHLAGRPDPHPRRPDGREPGPGRIPTPRTSWPRSRPGSVGAAGDSSQALEAARGEFAALVGRYALTSAFEEVSPADGLAVPWRPW